MVSSVETPGALRTGFETVNLHRPTERSDFAMRVFSVSLIRESCPVPPPAAMM